MKANNLRLGNLFIEETTYNLIEVIGLEKDRIIFSGRFLEKWQAKPIPLTYYWLLKFGFKQTGSTAYSFDKFICEYFLQDVIVSFRIKVNPADSLFIKDIKHVHELQNLYFALAGEELEVKR
jgi:hypothetical protein